MKIKTNELAGHALNWAVAKCGGMTVEKFSGGPAWILNGGYVAAEKDWEPSENWEQGGPIMEREDIHPKLESKGLYFGYKWNGVVHLQCAYGPTPLIAAMRCYVHSKLGNEVEVPDILIEEVKGNGYLEGEENG